MTRQLTIIWYLLAVLCVQAQATYTTRTGEIRFNASTPLEDINAINSEVNGIFKKDNGDIGAVLLIRDFRFRKKLMEEHFNENYIESGKFPKATFRGTLAGFRNDSILREEYPLNGVLTIREIEREISTVAAIRQRGENLVLETEFIARPEDFDIRVPRLLFKKIAQEVKVSVSMELQPSEK
ncbi:YceI-like domain-containing protein [Zeaxanthinibacter enoshimensis]|uniref:YceI-like domain-containing protein n=2 Tax=Zeaxanthinibacter enoshimensis TaxID=392009 RepID=A0A4R6TJT9_9FLAO|nr:YceI-like domain-containing protein [Zeaxanthinibacter enoshimensis]